MPQMAPINWLSLYISFTLIFIILIILIYYMFLYKKNTSIMMKTKFPSFWKW